MSNVGMESLHWRGAGVIIGMVIGLKHKLCASVKVSAGNTWWTSLLGNCTSEAAGIGSGKVQGDGRGRGNQPALW